jgi:hypothetical protein
MVTECVAFRRSLRRRGAKSVALAATIFPDITVRLTPLNAAFSVGPERGRCAQ